VTEVEELNAFVGQHVEEEDLVGFGQATLLALETNEYSFMLLSLIATLDVKLDFGAFDLAVG